jgi:cytochrome c-type biogenesis protein CcmH/NrfF
VELVVTSAETTTTLLWLTPAVMALLLYGLGQGFVQRVSACTSHARARW